MTQILRAHTFTHRDHVSLTLQTCRGKLRYPSTSFHFGISDSPKTDVDLKKPYEYSLDYLSTMIVVGDGFICTSFEEKWFRRRHLEREEPRGRRGRRTERTPSCPWTLVECLKTSTLWDSFVGCDTRSTLMTQV